MYDVAIIGAGFAGSNLASKLEGLDIIVLDKDEAKKNVSAVTFTELMGDRVIRETYSKFILFNTQGDIIEYSFDEDVFCLVDYSKLCKETWNEIETVEVIYYKGNTIYTRDDKIEAKVIVDCSGID